MHKKIRRNNVDYSPIEIKSKKVHRNDVDISLITVISNKVIEITSIFFIQYASKEVHRNDVEFSLNEIILKKICRKHVDFSHIQIKLKRYVKMLWKFIDIFFSMYRSNIDIKSMSSGLDVFIA